MATPESFGFVRCSRCGVYRRADGVRPASEVTPGASGVVCIDLGVCSRLAEVGRGALELGDMAP